VKAAAAPSKQPDAGAVDERSEKEKIIDAFNEAPDARASAKILKELATVTDQDMKMEMR